jgi:hypothetical protein
MKLVPSLLVAAALFYPTFALAQPDDAEELAKNPKYMEQDVKPAYKTVTAKQLQDGVKVISARGHAVFGFNAPEVQIHFPAIDNNVFAQIKFADATLFDANGNEVPYEREDGFYTHDDLSSETRFVTGDAESLVEFARAKGTVTVRYPSKIRTVSVKTSDAAAMKKAGIVIDGVYVKVYEESGIVEESFGSPIQGLRAYDAKGRRLERVMGYSSGGSDEVGSYSGFAIHGGPARVDVDVIDEWIGLEFEYDLPPAPLLPESRMGLRPAKPEKIAETPGGKVTSKEVKIIPPEVLGWYAGQSRESLEEMLREYGYPHLDEDALLGAAGRGEIEALRIVLASGISPDAGASDGMTALISAAAVGQNEAAMLLIKAGANVNAVDMNNSSALLWASQRCDNADLVRALIKAGADVNVQARGTATPMMMATVMKCEENQKILKEAGAKEWKPGQ